MPPFWSDSIPCAPHASVLTALRHRGRIFAVHAAENAKVIMGLCPTPHKLFPTRRKMTTYVAILVGLHSWGIMPHTPYCSISRKPK